MNRARAYAFGGTLLAMGAVVAWLCLTAMSRPAEKTDGWPPVDSATVTMADEYIEPELANADAPEDNPAQGEPVTGEEATPGQASGMDAEDAGEKAPVAAPATQTPPSPVKVKTPRKAEKTGTPRPRPDARAERARDINTDVSGAFTPRAQNSSGNNARRPANPDGGNTAAKADGVSAGIAEIGNGWSLDHTGGVGGRGKPLGKVVIRVTVDENGRVVSAVPAGGTPPASTNAATIEECRRAALQSSFRLAPGAEARRSTTGTITWHFK